MSRVALTFDNGPDPEVTPRVLDVLRDRGVLAHFYVLGQHLATPTGRALAERAKAAGHIVGNHSYTHATPLGDDPRLDAVAREIVATEALLGPLNAPLRRFRPFGGGGVLGPHLLSQRAVAHLIAQRYTCVLWNSVPRDWVEPDQWAARALADCTAHAHAVVVLHDVPGACLASLGAFLDAARAAGHEFTQDLPPECVPIADGAVLADLGRLVT